MKIWEEKRVLYVKIWEEKRLLYVKIWGEKRVFYVKIWEEKRALYVKTSLHLLQYLDESFSEWETFQSKIFVEKIKICYDL